MEGAIAVAKKLIGDFFNELTENPSLLEEYEQDQRGVLQRKSGLDQEQQDLLLSKDQERIRKAVQDEYKKAGKIDVAMPKMHIA
jgi:hypothetical protein